MAHQEEEGVGLTQGQGVNLNRIGLVDFGEAHEFFAGRIQNHKLGEVADPGMGPQLISFQPGDTSGGAAHGNGYGKGVDIVKAGDIGRDIGTGFPDGGRNGTIRIKTGDPTRARKRPNTK
jgi:hypothetical protein